MGSEIEVGGVRELEDLTKRQVNEGWDKSEKFKFENWKCFGMQREKTESVEIKQSMTTMRVVYARKPIV